MAITLLGISACAGEADPGVEPALRTSALAGGRAGPDARDWRMAAHDSSGHGFNHAEHGLGVHNAGDLEVKWTFDASAAGAPVAPIHAIPVVADGRTFVGSYAGRFYAIDRHGGLDWTFDTFEAGPLFSIFFPGSAPVVAAAVLPDDEDSVLLGDIDGRVYKLDRDSGTLLWSIDLDDTDLGGIWGNSLMVEGDTVYVGIASFETLAPFFTSFRPCCSHRGAVVALDLASGSVRWRYETITEGEQGPLPAELGLGDAESFGPSGGDVWSQPTYDAETDTVYVGTGQLFSRSADGSGPTTHDAVIALDAQTGVPRWVTHLSDNVDVYRFDIAFFDPATGQYFDKDVADQPKVYRLADGRRVVGSGQKSGEYHVLDAATGAVISSHQHAAMVIGEGGLQSGGATDGKLVFQHGVTTASDAAFAYDGVVMGLSLDGASVEWELSRPGAPLFGSVAAANGVVYFQSPFESDLEVPGVDPPSWALYAVRSDDGAVLKRVVFESSRAVNGPVVSRGRVYAAFGNAFDFGLATSAGAGAGGVVCLGLPEDDLNE